MRNIIFSCFKMSSSISLNLIKQYFLDIGPQKGKSLVKLEEKQIEEILKYPIDGKKAYIFDFGCITLINFTEPEKHVLFNFLSQIFGKIDYNLYVKYYDQHKIEIDDNGLCELYKTSNKKIAYETCMEPIISTIIAKSTALDKIETDVNSLLDESENYIKMMQSGIIHIKARKFALITSKILRMEYYLINNIRILERSENFKTIEESEIYSELSEYYELSDRVVVIREKINNLKDNTKKYSAIAYRKTQNNQYVVEAFLMALFPVFYLIQILQSKNNIFNLIGHFFK